MGLWSGVQVHPVSGRRRGAICVPLLARQQWAPGTRAAATEYVNGGGDHHP
ncbi:hypothetical protein K2D_11600 [Planctomycetes bacterium K2D]|uniref:Uncharacterized protein n=1 Tax=Botrimarina mediterranea TaxID=2528022 RepID=A0A518K5B4_9BACT|nr:hypothetical protein Spa11_11770 [Botrimarina mediterranea]QDV77564.1 hypothetical protein K2D_11600 [Planctomycetes bacterium K2D]